MNCCTGCFSIQEIKSFIEGNEETGDCDYCGSKSVNIANAREVGEFIMEGINRAYEDPAEQVGYSDGEYNITPTDLEEILIFEEDIFSDIIDDPSKFINESVPDEIGGYVQKDPYGPLRGDSDTIYHWEHFCRFVKTNRRYTAFLPDEEPKFHNMPHPADFMKSMVSSLAMGHFNVLNKGTKIFRARIQKAGVRYKNKDLTSPPPKNARNNRMSPAGVSLFYGALEPETCISELRPGVGELVVVGKFMTTKDLTVLDLSEKIDEAPSIFSEEYSYNYEGWISFIRHFVADISKPIRPMDQEIDYVPTQIFTEFLRIWDFKDQLYSDGKDQENKTFHIDGLQFKCSLRENGKNVVLFGGPEISLKNNSEIGPWLNYKGQQTYEVDQVVVKSKIVRLDDDLD